MISPVINCEIVFVLRVMFYNQQIKPFHLTTSIHQLCYCIVHVYVILW
jgi:hypothetical protein